MNSRQSAFHTHNLFKGRAGIVVRKLLDSAGRKWTGRELAEELKLSQAWVNRVLDHLLREKFIFRNQQGRNSYIVLEATQKILKHWLHYYRISHNPFYFYLKENPLKNIGEISLKENFWYALTGFQAANRIRQIVHNAPPMFYLWPGSSIPAPGAPEVPIRPKSGDGDLFGEILTRLENVYDFIPVRKKANLIILKPVQKEAVFFESKPVNGTPVVSPIQLFLDLHGLSRGPFMIEQLADYWAKNGIDYEI